MPSLPSPEALFVRLYFDRHIMARLSDDLRGRGFDVLTTEEAGLDTVPQTHPIGGAANTASRGRWRRAEPWGKGKRKSDRREKVGPLVGSRETTMERIPVIRVWRPSHGDRLQARTRAPASYPHAVRAGNLDRADGRRAPGAIRRTE